MSNHLEESNKIQDAATDVTYSTEKIESEGQKFIDAFKAKIKDSIDDVLGEAYSKIMPYIETDTYMNYRQALRTELEHEYKYTDFKQYWATNFRRSVFVENREEIAKLISKDILKRIKELEDVRQEFPQFRYSPNGVTYGELRAENDRLKIELEKCDLSCKATKVRAARRD